MTVEDIVRRLRGLRSRFSCRFNAGWLRVQGVRIDRRANVFAGAVVERQGGDIIVGADTTIHAGARIFAAGGSVVIGQRCSVNPGCVLYGHGGLTIGNDVRIAANTVIVPANHTVDNPAMPIRTQGETRQGIAIGNDVWVGAGAVILDGVRVADGSVIGAGAVLTVSTVSNGIYVGSPARLLRLRGVQR